MIVDKRMLQKYVAEFLGTFALVFFGCGTRAMVGDTTNFAGILLVHLAFGLTVAAMIYTLGRISGGIINPALTLGFAVARRFPWRYVLLYWLAQVAGAVCASFIHFLILGDRAVKVHFGATLPKAGMVVALVLEFILTFFLMLVNMGTATDRGINRAAAGLAVGFTIIICGLFGNSLSGASMNPARSLGPALFAGGAALATLWIYIVAPLAGAICAAIVYELIRPYEKEVKPVVEDLTTRETKRDQRGAHSK